MNVREQVRGRLPLVAGVAVFVALAAVLVLRGQAPSRTNAFERPATQLNAMTQAATTGAGGSVPLGGVCAPGAKFLTITEVRPFGVTGELIVDGVRVGATGSTVDLPVKVVAQCDIDEPQPVAVEVGRAGGEAAHADGLDVTYRVDGRTQKLRLDLAFTLCRQLSEC